MRKTLNSKRNIFEEYFCEDVIFFIKQIAAAFLEWNISYRHIFFFLAVPLIYVCKLLKNIGFALGYTGRGFR